jgi:hypothetical protein
MLRVLENCDYTDVISVLIELVKKYAKVVNARQKITGLAIKCLVKIKDVYLIIIDLGFIKNNKFYKFRNSINKNS